MTSTKLPLFPLGTVLFPGGLLPLKVFEARYLDLISTCLRERRPFGVVALLGGREVRASEQAGREAVRFEPLGTLAELIDVDSAQQGILTVRCRGMQRFELSGSRRQADGLWLGDAHLLADDVLVAPEPALQASARSLATAIEAMRQQDVEPFIEPYRLDDAGWVANRWCEILPIPQEAKQKLMALPDPMLRLRLVDDYLRSNGLVTQPG